MLEHMWASRFTPLQMRRQNCERRGVFRKSLIAGLALVFVITSIYAFAAPATASAADPGSALGPSIQYQ